MTYGLCILVAKVQLAAYSEQAGSLKKVMANFSHWVFLGAEDQISHANAR